MNVDAIYYGCVVLAFPVFGFLASGALWAFQTWKTGAPVRFNWVVFSIVGLLASIGLLMLMPLIAMAVYG